MSDLYICKNLSQNIVMTGVYYKNNHPGGISAVIQYWSMYIENLQYYPTFKEGGKLTKLYFFSSSYLHLFLKFILDRRVKIVHVHTAAGTDFKRSSMIIALAKKFNKKVVLHSHASQMKDFYYESTEINKKKIIKTLEKIDVLVVLSKTWKDWFENIGVAPQKIVILHNITTYPTIIDGHKLSIENRPIRFLFMGEIGQRKGVFDILRALSKHKYDLQGKIELRIGGNKMEDELLSVIEEYGLNDMVCFEGFVSGDKKIEMLNWADVFILPSFNEGLPISILEAMSYHMPIISTPVGGIPEIVDQTNGILVSPGNDNEIYEAIKKYVDCHFLISTQGKKSYQKVISYLPDYVLNSLKEIYENLLV